MKRNQFTFYRSFYEAVIKLPPEQHCALLLSVIEYALNKSVSQELKPAQEAVFIVIKANLDAAWEKAAKGVAGGRQKGLNAAEKNSKGNSKEKEKKKIKEKLKDKTETKGEGFPEFWERYPLKVAMEAARDEYVRVCEDKNLILSGLEAWRQSRQWALEDGRFVPRADKWLRERWWEQSPPGYIPKGASGVLGKDEIDAINRLMEGEGT